MSSEIRTSCKEYSTFFTLSKCFNTLANTRTPEEALEAVKEAYKAKYGDEYRDKLLEQGRLLYLVRELDKDGKPIMWEFE